MMQHEKGFGGRTSVTGAAFLVALLLLEAPASAQDREALVRVAHLSPDTAAVDVHLNDEPVETLAGLPFQTVSPYLPIPDGRQNIKIYAAGDKSQPVIEADVDVRGGAAYTVGMVGLTADGTLAGQVYEDDLSPPDRGKTKLRVVHTVPDVAEIDVSTSGGPSIFTDLGFPNATSYAEVPAGTYTFEAKPAGEDEVAFEIPDGEFAEGTIYSAFVVGQAASGELDVLAAGYAGESAAEQSTGLLSVEAYPAAVPLRDTGTLAAETGGTPPALLLAPFGAAVLLALAAFGTLWVRSRAW